MTLDQLPIGQYARIVSVDWNALVEEEARRLRALGLEEGARVSIAHRGIFVGRDPVAIAVGRMIVAVRRAHARAMTVLPLDKVQAESEIDGAAAAAASPARPASSGVAA